MKMPGIINRLLGRNPDGAVPAQPAATEGLPPGVGDGTPFMGKGVEGGPSLAPKVPDLNLANTSMEGAPNVKSGETAAGLPSATVEAPQTPGLGSGEIKG